METYKQTNLIRGNKEITKKAVRLAGNVDFLNEEEFIRYAGAIYSAIVWGRKLDQENSNLKGGIR